MTSPRNLLSTMILIAGAALALGCSKDSAAPAATSSAAPAAAKPTGKLTSVECQKLYEHVMDVGVSEMMKDKDTTAGMNEAEKKKFADDMRKEVKNDPETKKIAAGCEKDFNRAEYDCMMKAKTEKALEACESVE